jgi:uncharacterized iron-regulated membrane protein
MRKVLFWLHLAAGVVAGLIIFVMCVTGGLLAFERQMLDWADRHNARVIPPPGAARLPLSDLIANSEATPAAIIVRSDPTEPVEVSISRDRTIYLNPYTGAATGAPCKTAHGFFQGVRAWHRWVALSDASRNTTRPIYDAANLVFLFIVISGPVLWFPKKFTWRHVRPIVWFKGRLSGKARDFNWHNTMGLWMSIPLAVIVASGVVMSYQWANAMLYKATGTEPPKQVRAEAMPKNEALPAWQGVDAWIATAESKMSGWKTITVRNAPTRTVSLSVDAGTGGQPQKRATLTLDRLTGAETRWETFSSNNLGLKLRMLARVAHTGEVGGIVFQALAGLASFVGAVLVYTGIALSLRRLAAWRRRRSRSEVGEAAQVA